MKYFTECVILQLLVSSLVSVVLLLFCNKIPYVYNLTDLQYQLFSKCLFWYAVLFPIRQLGRFLDVFFELQCRNVLSITGNILFYAVMLLLDVLVIAKHGECYHLILTTGIAYCFYLLCMVVFGKVLHEFNRPSLQRIRECMLAAWDCLVSNVFHKVSTTIFSVFASYLGTELYAYHSIGDLIAQNAVYLVSMCYSYQLVCLNDITSLKDKYKKYIETMRKTFLPCVVLCYLLLCLLIVPLHGDTDLKFAFFISCLYCTQCFAQILYENSRGFLASVGYSKAFTYGNLIGIVSMLVIAFASRFLLGIYGFAFAMGINFLIRGLYFFYVIHKILKRNPAIELSV